MDVSKLFGNKIVQNAALGTLKKAMTSHSLRLVVVRLDDQGEFSFDFKTEDCALVTPADLAKYQAAVLQNLQYGTSTDAEDTDRDAS